jgi:hypothetical protein
MDRLDFKQIANARISGRIKQAVVLLLSIIIGVLISMTVGS